MIKIDEKYKNIKNLINEGLCNTDISILLGMRYDDVKNIIKKNNLKSNRWNQKIYPYVYYNKKYDKYYYVFMKSNEKFFYEFKDKDTLYNSIKSENWECPKVVGEYI